MNLYLDFDGTLFNTDKFYQDYLDLLKEYKINKDIIDKEKENLFKNSLFNLDTLTKQLINKYNLDKVVFDKVNNLYNNTYVFQDVIPFLEKNKTKKIYLLTYGEYNYQIKKINGSKLSKYFQDIIITDKDKSKLNLDYKNSIFIDNNPSEIEKFLKVSNNVIRIRRREDKYSKIDFNTLEYKSLQDIEI